MLSATIDINSSTTIDGAGQSVTISGNNAVRVFLVFPSITFTLNNLTIANGHIPGVGDGGGGISNLGATVTVTNCTFSANSSDWTGGGILNNNGGTLTITNSTFSGNSSQISGGGIFNNGGGGNTLIITNSTFSGNSTVTDGGGGIKNGGTATVTNSTFSGNSATSSFGGGIYNVSSASKGTLTVTNSTFSGNSGVTGGAIYNDTGSELTVTNGTFGGASTGNVTIFDRGTATLKNTIVGVQGESACASITTIVDAGYNLSTDSSCSFSQSTSKNGVSAADLSLVPLASNGGPTQTIALGVTSIALDAIPIGTNGCGTTIATDQRGFPRPQNSKCEIGALEIFTTIVGTGTQASCTDAALRSAIGTGGQVAFNCGSPTTITLASTINISSNIAIDGGQQVSISGNGTVRVFLVNTGVTLSLKNLAIVNGFGISGGGIINQGTLQVANVSFSGNTGSGGSGGGIYNDNGRSLRVTNSAFNGNSATSGGGIVNFGTLDLTSSTFAGNSAAAGGGILSFGSLNVINTTFSGNSATAAGGGISNNGTLTINYSTFSGNSAANGGGVSNASVVQVRFRNSILAGNGGGNCFSTNSILDDGFNLSDDFSCNFSAFGSINNVSAAALNLGPLASNGGPTQTVALKPGSVAIDAILNGFSNSGCATFDAPIAADQRGISRPQNTNCDIGAFERAPSDPNPKQVRGQVTSD